MGQDPGPDTAQQDHRQYCNRVGPKACVSEELKDVRAAALINHSGSSSASEVGLNFPPHHSAVAHGSSRFVEPCATKWYWYRFVPLTGTNGIFRPFQL